jgi:hypothetical protein
MFLASTKAITLKRKLEFVKHEKRATLVYQNLLDRFTKISCCFFVLQVQMIAKNMIDLKFFDKWIYKFVRFFDSVFHSFLSSQNYQPSKTKLPFRDDGRKRECVCE